MRVVEIAEFGGPEVLRAVERPTPVAGQTLVRVHAATVNPVDWWTRAGRVPVSRPLPIVLGWDFAGELVATGQRVAGMVPWFDADTGAYAELIAVQQDWLAPLPENLSYVDGATVPLNALTATQALSLIQAGRILVSGASGAVGGYAVQLAVAAGLEVVAIASYDDEAHVAGLGAAQVLHRDEPLTIPPVDAVLDAALIGEPLVAAVRDGGQFVAVTDSAAPMPERDITVSTVHVQPDAERLDALLKAVAAGNLSARIAGAVPLDQAADAHRRASAGGVRGKLVLTM